MRKFGLSIGVCAAVLLSACDIVPVSMTDGATTTGGLPAIRPVVPIGENIRAQARAFVQVAQTVEPIAEQTCRNRAPRLNCDFLIVVDDRPDQPPNAFQTEDAQGRPIIAFTLSLIENAQNQHELAFVMAHEAAHHIEGHLEQQQRNATLGAIVFGQLAGAAGADAAIIENAQEVGAVLGARSYSKDFELEADRLGALIARRAGYDPMTGAAFFFRVPDPGDEFLGTHPANADRVEAVRQVSAQLASGT